MIFRFFKRVDPVVIIATIFMAIGFWLIPFIFGTHIEPLPARKSMPFFYPFYVFFSGHILLGHSISFLIIVFSAFYISRFNNKFILLQSRSNLPVFFFILLTGGFIFPHPIHPALFANIFLMVAIEKIFATYRNDPKWLNFFDAGLLLATGCLFDEKLFFFFILVFIALLILRPFKGREWLVSIIGFSLPFIFLLTYFLYVENSILNSVQVFFSLLFDFEEINIFSAQIVFWISLLILVFLSSLHSVVFMQYSKVSVRKYYLVFFWVFAVCLVIFFISGFHMSTVFVYSALPLSYLLSNYFHSIRFSFWYELLFSVFILALIFLELNVFGVLKI